MDGISAAKPKSGGIAACISIAILPEDLAIFDHSYNAEYQFGRRYRLASGRGAFMLAIPTGLAAGGRRSSAPTRSCRGPRDWSELCQVCSLTISSRGLETIASR
jgi:hypothetical protein